MIRRFIKYFGFRMAIFFLPIALLMSFPAWVLWVSGEWTPMDKVVQAQQVLKVPLRVGLAYSNPAKYYKLKSLMARNAEIVAFGSSHLMAFRENFFTPRTFYNAAVGGSRLNDFEKFISHVPIDCQPKILIVGLDPFFAKPDFDWSQKEEDRFDRRAGPLDAIRILGTSWKSVYKDLFLGKFSASQLLAANDMDDKPIGLEAVVKGSGFLNDGAYFHNKPASAAEGEAPDRSNLKDGETYDEVGINMLDRFLQICHDRNLRVIGILPPVRERVYDQLNSSGYLYWKELPKKLEPFFKSRGFSIYDFSSPSFYGGNDAEFYDDFHAAEDAYRRVADKIIELEQLSKP